MTYDRVSIRSLLKMMMYKLDFDLILDFDLTYKSIKKICLSYVYLIQPVKYSDDESFLGEICFETSFKILLKRLTRFLAFSLKTKLMTYDRVCTRNLLKMMMYKAV